MKRKNYLSIKAIGCIASFAICIVIIFSSLPLQADAASKKHKEIDAYKKALVSEEINLMTKYNDYYNELGLYDLNGDGIKEIILILN